MRIITIYLNNIHNLLYEIDIFQPSQKDSYIILYELFNSENFGMFRCFCQTHNFFQMD